MSEDGHAAIALALLRATLVIIILIGEQLIDTRQLADSGFFYVLAAAAAYAGAGIVFVRSRLHGHVAQKFEQLQPALDVLFLAALAYTSGGGFSDLRKAFFVIPLAAAFRERPRQTAGWSLVAVAAFTVQAAFAQGRPVGAQNSWLQATAIQDLYLAWTGVAATLLALALRRRQQQIEQLAAARLRLVTHAIESVERERTRLAGALHDSPVQNLIAARHDLRRAERSADLDSFRRVHDALDNTIEQLRDEIVRLHPHVLDHVGLRAALEQVARRHSEETGVRVALEVAPEADFPHQKVLFALGRELLGNAAKHGRPREIRLRLTRREDCIVLEVTDDGCGIEDGRMRQALLDGHIGLAAATERIEALHGSVAVTTAPGRGTSVRVTLPSHEAPRSSHQEQYLRTGDIVSSPRLSPA